MHLNLYEKNSVLHYLPEFMTKINWKSREIKSCEFINFARLNLITLQIINMKY